MRSAKIFAITDYYEKTSSSGCLHSLFFLYKRKYSWQALIGISIFFFQKKSTSSTPQKATAMYNYNPEVDSPYKQHHRELRLKQGDSVQIVGPQAEDGFCEIQVSIC